jgi:hypothetical protein
MLYQVHLSMNEFRTHNLSSLNTEMTKT